MNTINTLLGVALLAALNTPARAHENESKAPHALSHAPIGVMADHRHKKGEWMLSYRFMNMDMDGNRMGTKTLQPDTIATSIPNRFFGAPGQPPTLRVVPSTMSMDMHMIGAMVGLTNRITIMGMTSIVAKDMDHLTYQGGMGTNILGGFTTKTSGMGDSTLSAIVGLDNGVRSTRQINLKIGLSLPTGSNEQTGQILTPMGGTPSPRLPYAMQLGSGTYDLGLGLTYTERASKIGWGGQVSTRLALGKNDQGYAYGSHIEGTAWAAYEPRNWVSVSGRLKASSQAAIDGIDAAIIAPVQTADPDNQGGERITALFGLNLAGQSGIIKGHRLALEVGLPIVRDLNGLQLETDKSVTLGWQKAF